MGFVKIIGGVIKGVLWGAIASLVASIPASIFTTNEKANTIITGVFLLFVLIYSVPPIKDAIEDWINTANQKKYDAQLKQRELQAERKKREDQKGKLIELHTESLATYTSLYRLVPAANSHLDIAEKEFLERAFSPFWDAIERVANTLAEYHHGIKSINNNADNYRSQSKTLGMSMPEFELPLGQLPDARPVADRLNNVVRKAQKDYEFASIYEQKRTNKLLHSGFGTLASAIESMHSSIGDELFSLSISINTGMDELLLQNKRP